MDNRAEYLIARQEQQARQIAAGEHLSNVIDERDRTRARLRELDTEVAEAIYDAKNTGMPMKAIREITGITSQAIHSHYRNVSVRRSADMELEQIYVRFPHLAPQTNTAEEDMTAREWVDYVVSKGKPTQPAHTADEA